MGRRSLAILAATLIALLGVVSVMLYANRADARAVAGQQPKTVFVTTALLPSGTTLKDAVRTGLLKQTSVAAKGLPVGALTAVTDENSRLVAVSDIPPGEYVQESRFGTTPIGRKAIEVPGGMIAVSVQLSDPARVGTFVTPGTHLVIFDSYKIKALGDSNEAKQLNQNDVKGTSILLPDVLVIAMGQSALNPGSTSTANGNNDNNSQQQGTPSFLVTVAVSPQDAAKLVHGINTGTLYAGLRGSDVKTDGVKRVDDLNLFKFKLSDVGR
jgi:pilus assembly protein CpaB